jgi:hypothetical protein
MPKGVGYASSNVIAGTGLELNYVGNYVYAYSGTFQSLNSAATMLNFTTGAKSIIGEIQCNGSVRLGDSDSGDTTAFQISFNGVVVGLLKTESGQENSPPFATQTFVLPPYTNVQVVRDGTADNTNNLNTVGFTGKVIE